MRRTTSLIVIVALLAGSTLRAAALDLYVAPDGNDASAGTIDKPFATLERARNEIRKERPHGATVHLRGGTYYLTEPFTLAAEDSGTPDAPVIYEAADNETPVFSGGVAITGWKVDDKGRWQVTIPEVQRGEWRFSQLFVNGVRRFRPRLPKKGYYTIADEMKPTNADRNGYDRFRFKPGDVRGDFKNLGDVESLCFLYWSMSRLPIASVDDAEHVVTFTGGTRGTADYAKPHKGWRYILENVGDALGEPGEWYLDCHTGVLTYVPEKGEDPATAQVVAPRLDQLVKIEGDVKTHHWVHDVVFRGLIFEHTNWNVPKEGYASPQAELPILGAIHAIGARNCVFDHCTVRHVGTYGMELAGGCKGNRVENCTLTDLGAGGVKIGEPSISDDPEAVASNNKLVNNLIIHGGRLHPAGIGVLVLQSPDNVVQHNEIADFYYTGISSGWTWGYGKALATGNQYLDNYVHQIGQGVLSDMGGIYTLGNHAGSVIRGNRFEQIESFVYGGWGIYYDEGTTGIVAEDNLCRATKTGAFHQHYGKDNAFRNNVCVGGREQWAERSRVEPDHLSFTFEHNVLVGDQPRVWEGNWKDHVKVDYNVYWLPGGTPQFDGKSFAEWQKASGQDAHSVVADPQFVDSAAGNFAVKPGSPAEGVGFKPFDVGGAGLTGAMRSTPRPTAPAAYPTQGPGAGGG